MKRNFMEKEFINVESKLSKYANIMIKILFYTGFLGIPLFGSLFLFWMGADNPGLIVLVLFFALLIFFGAQLNEKKPKIRRIMVNKDGVFYYNDDDELMDKVLYTDLCGSGFIYDIGIKLKRKYKRLSEEFTVFNPEQRGVYFHLEAANINLQRLNNVKRLEVNPLWNDISNEMELQKHFIKGIQTFRPDLKIDPLILKLFRL
ncbi:hypothetical protein VO54_03683 [Elizabethkingia miricola]|nr:hypothetical protein VO54_03683 [Elizabethkingia miricola]